MVLQLYNHDSICIFLLAASCLMSNYLICTNQVHDYADMGNIHKPKGLVEPKPCKDVAGCRIAKGGITQAPTKKVEGSCYG